jgi:hypothetical protein
MLPPEEPVAELSCNNTGRNNNDSVKGKAWTEVRQRIYISVHKGLEVLMAVGNDMITAALLCCRFGNIFVFQKTDTLAS